MTEPLSQRAVVPAELAGQRCDQVAARLLPAFSRNRLKQWIQSGHLTIDGRSVAPKTRLEGGEEMVLEAEEVPQVPLVPQPIDLSVRYEDESVFVIDKPAGLTVHPGAGQPDGTLQNALLNRDPALAGVPRAGIVHRLDKETSGLLVIGRTLQAQAALAAQIEARSVRRTYHAVCQTVMTGGGLVDAPIGRHPQDRTRMCVREGGREARTHYRVIERFRAHTYIEVNLDTGRTHQIRVHMAHVRAPLVGDPVYGGRPRLPRSPDPQLLTVLQGFRRQALHAAELAFAHPLSGAELAFRSEVPADFAELLAALRTDLERST